MSTSDIAIIGLAGRFPGAEDIGTFWQNLCAGIESISFFSDADLTASGVDPARQRDPHYVRASGVLSDVESFDARFFGYTPGEAAVMDPQHRLFLECAWQALEDAGYNPERYDGLIGVYAGASMNTYLYHNLQADKELLNAGGGYHVMVASDKDFLTTKASYKLNLKGPSVTIQTACSTSLVAIHLACQSLRNGECDMALAGGVSVRVPHKAGYVYQEGIVLSPDGHCRAFDAQAGGTVLGNGVGLVVLKPLAEALADGDCIYALIKGSTINNDGSLKAGYTAPSLDAQAAVIAEAQGVAGVAAGSITYVETHGTGTVIGDPIEIAALTKAFRFSTDRKQFCAIGSVKTNIGHLDAAAGVAGLVKTVLALQHKQIPPSLNFKNPNPKIAFENSPFYVNTQLSQWHANGLPRRAGVSSFGIGGTNAHVVLEEAPEFEPSGESRPWQLLVLSARSESALDAATTNLAAHLEQHPNLNLADVAYTLQVGRKTFEQRRMLVCRDTGEARANLQALDPTRVFTRVEEATARPVAFMFTGQGAQYVNMGLELYQTEPTFRKLIDECAELLRPHLGLDLRELLYPDPDQSEAATTQLSQTALTQPALFVIEYALAQLWMEWGVRPQALIGHSIGEYVAACLAGVFSLEHALVLVAARGRLMQQLPGGAMLSVPLSERELKPFLSSALSIGVINGPSRCVVSGTTAAVEALQNQLDRKGVTTQRLHTSHAFHSPMMEPIVEAFKEQVKRVPLNPPQLPCVSNLTGTWLTAAEATSPDYWARHLRETVRFADGVRQLMQDPTQILLEVGPGRTLATLAMQHPDRAKDQVVLSSLRHPQDQPSDIAFVLTTLGKLWLTGARIDWAGFHAHERRLRVGLPTYSFDRERCWIELQSRTTARADQRADSRTPDISDWFYIPTWKRSIVSTQPAQKMPIRATWLIFADECGLGTQLITRLEQGGQDVILVRPGLEFQRGERAYVLNPARSEDYNALLADLLAQNQRLQTIVHLWNIIRTEEAETGLESLDQIQDRGFYSLLWLAQALGKQNFTEPLNLTVVSNNLQEVTGEEIICPDQATLLGPVQIIPYEYPNVRCRSIDVVLPQTELQTARLINLLWDDLASESPEQIIAYRGNHRWVQAFEPMRLQALEATPRLKQGGVYVITGGLGGIGLTLAGQLADSVQAKLVLIGRSEFPAPEAWEQWLSTHNDDDAVSRTLRQVYKFQAHGAEVMVIPADVADLEQMQSAVAQALARFGRIDGVIHAAGVPGAGMIQLKTRELAERVLRPKVKGTRVLAQVLKDVPLDFLILCSSINSIVGRLGQVDYVAANAFLDAFVHHDTAVPLIDINWETWREVGMAANMLKGLAGTGVTTRSSSRPINHPLLDQCLVETDEQSTCITTFSVGKHWELHEHGILGRPTLPGTTYLEMARAAYQAMAGDGAIEIRDAYFLTPLILEADETKQVRTVLKRQGEDFAFAVMSQSGEAWQEHARGVIAPLKTAAPSENRLSEIESRCREQEIANPLEQARLGGFELQRRTIQRGAAQDRPVAVDAIVIAEGQAPARSMEFGPRWHSLKSVKLGLTEGLALLELPVAYRADLEPYQLHPALLDFATSFLRLFKSEGSYLPLSYKRLRMWKPLPARLYSYVRFAEGNPARGVTLRFDVTLLDEQGMELVEIDEFAVMRIDDVGKLDALARSSGLPSSFSPAGTTQHRTAARTQLLEQDLRDGLSSAEGVEVLNRILASTLRQVVVSTRDLSTRIEQNSLRHVALVTEPPAPVFTPKHARPKLMSAYAAPQNETEQKLAEIWQEVLGIESVGIYDNFFELGGDSLLITRIHSKFIERFHRDMSVANLLQYPTIADLARFLSEQSKAKPPSFEELHAQTSKQKAAIKQRQQKLLQKERRQS